MKRTRKLPMDVTPATITANAITSYNYSKNLHWNKILPQVFTKNGNRRANAWFYDRPRSRSERKDDVSAVYTSRIPFAFDIETYTVPENNHAYMYVWQFLIGDVVIIGRKWEEFVELLDRLHNHFRTGVHIEGDKAVKNEITILDANLNFEFQFFKRRLNISDVFAKKTTSLLSCTTREGIHFRDALVMSGGALKDIPKTYNTPTQKLVGDLDYTIPRNSQTVLSPDELQYCINDVVILGEFWRWLIATYIDQNCDIPSTRTGVLRDSVKGLCKRWVTAPKSYKEQWERADAIARMLPNSYDEQLALDTYLFRGGYTHANFMQADKVLTEEDDVNGVDFTSSYPAVMTQELFPVTAFEDYDYKSIDEILNDTSYAVIGWFRFTNISAMGCHSIESVSKTWEYVNDCHKSVSRYETMFNAVVDNGRVRNADVMTVMLTEQDLKTYLESYTFDKVEICKTKRSFKSHLPQWLLTPMVNSYCIKADLKRQGKDEDPAYKGVYQVNKGTTNSGYGMACQKLSLDEVFFDGMNLVVEPVAPEEINTAYLYALYGKGYLEDHDTSKPVKLPKTILSPYWGVYVTAYARRNLLKNLLQIGDDGVYCDTDSIYDKNHSQHVDIYTKYNVEARAKNVVWVDRLNAYNGFDRAYYDTITDQEVKDAYRKATHGVLIELVEDLGEFDTINKLGNYTKFKTLGAKRYLKTGPAKDKAGNIYYKTEQTVAGLPKTALLNWSEEHGVDPYDAFTDDMIIENCKNGHCYNDDPHQDIISDTQGHTEVMSEESSCGIFPIDFSMSITGEYINLIASAVCEEMRMNYYTRERI